MHSRTAPAGLPVVPGLGLGHGPRPQLCVTAAGAVLTSSTWACGPPVLPTREKEPRGPRRQQARPWRRLGGGGGRGRGNRPGLGGDWWGGGRPLGPEPPSRARLPAAQQPPPRAPDAPPSPCCPRGPPQTPRSHGCQWQGLVPGWRRDAVPTRAGVAPPSTSLAVGAGAGVALSARLRCRRLTSPRLRGTPAVSASTRPCHCSHGAVSSCRAGPGAFVASGCQAPSPDGRGEPHWQAKTRGSRGGAVLGLVLGPLLPHFRPTPHAHAHTHVRTHARTQAPPETGFPVPSGGDVGSGCCGQQSLWGSSDGLSSPSVRGSRGAYLGFPWGMRLHCHKMAERTRLSDCVRCRGEHRTAWTEATVPEFQSGFGRQPLSWVGAGDREVGAAWGGLFTDRAPQVCAPWTRVSPASHTWSPPQTAGGSQTWGRMDLEAQTWARPGG